MWDARFESIKDRKLNEMIIFSAMVRTDPSRRQEYVDIILHIARDLDVLDALQAEKPVPESEPIVSTLYRGRLSKYESLDEYVLDECRGTERKSGSPPERLPQAEASKSIEPPEALQSLDAPEKPQGISAPAAQQSIESPEIQQRLEAPEEPVRVEQPAEQDRIEPPEEPTKIEPPEEPVRVEQPAEQDRIEPAEGSAMKEEQPEPADMEGSYDTDPNFDPVVPAEDAVKLKKVREMKSSKIDHFIDEEMTGHTNDDACEEIISFLKTDIALINKILAIDITSRTSIRQGLIGIIRFVNEADEPSYQKVYLNSLNLSEKALEGEYNNILWRLEQAINARYPDLIDEEELLFFKE